MIIGWLVEFGMLEESKEGLPVLDESSLDSVSISSFLKSLGEKKTLQVSLEASCFLIPEFRRILRSRVPEFEQSPHISKQSYPEQFCCFIRESDKKLQLANKMRQAELLLRRSILRVCAEKVRGQRTKEILTENFLEDLAAAGL